MTFSTKCRLGAPPGAGTGPTDNTFLKTNIFVELFGEGPKHLHPMVCYLIRISVPLS
jgi:hypothetical protein